MLLSIGVVPVGIGETGGYRTWVAEPALPDEVVDVGVRNEPNLEALAALRPDLILVSPLSRPIVSLMAGIAPVREVALYTDDRDPLRRGEQELSKLAAGLGRSAEAAQAISRCADRFASARDRLAARASEPVVIISFLDGRHVRVFGPGSLFDAVLRRLEMANGWTRPGNLWGFELVGIEVLASLPDVRLVIVEPVPPDVRSTQSEGSLWANLPAVRSGRVTRLPSAWQFGELTAAARFADNLAAALTADGRPGAGG